ncbi:MAG: hypothetical protein AVDCRST_MAG07-1945, partial [uncultured Frankineae bacterium]
LRGQADRVHRSGLRPSRMYGREVRAVPGGRQARSGRRARPLGAGARAAQRVPHPRRERHPARRRRGIPTRHLDAGSGGAARGPRLSRDRL